ncbi:hypothetical protein ACFFLM_25590 [Deinococcus oregonensis]|uniref:Uncharacterized protein n=1 Tax=Deinococcus oregonensis TaxID=1805970 RepID=A0ABV6B6C9_9DEIO
MFQINKLSRISLTALTALTLASSAHAATSDFVGTWTNTNAATRGITRLILTPNGDGTLNVQVFGKCQPTDCDWGKAGVLTYGTSVSDTDHWLGSAVYPKGFSNTMLVMNLFPNKTLSVQSLTQFVDKSGRQNYASREVFRR